jgi:hypothetical protein
MTDSRTYPTVYIYSYIRSWCSAGSQGPLFFSQWLGCVAPSSIMAPGVADGDDEEAHDDRLPRLHLFGESRLGAKQLADLSGGGEVSASHAIYVTCVSI